MSDEPLTEAVGDTRAAHPLGAEAAFTPLAWGADNYPDNWEMRADWKRKARKVAARGLPALAVAGGIVAYALAGRPAPPTPPSPSPAPYVPVWDGHTTPAQDDAYVNALNEDGLVVGSRENALASGRYFCALRSSGQSINQIIAIADSWPPGAGEGPQAAHADDVLDVNDALKTLCPQFAEKGV